MVVAIHAYEGQYGGLHGICSREVIEVDNIKDAEEYAVEMSEDVMGSYGDIMDEFYSQAEDEGLEEGSAEYDEFISECISENVEYELWEVSDCYDTIKQMSEDFYNSPDEFVKEHCKEVE